jgi:hypothetical protein
MCLPLDPRLVGSNLAMSNGFLRMIKIHSMTCFRGEVKPSAICYKVLQHIKDPLRYDILVGKIQQPFLVQFLPALLLGVSAATRAVNSG